jgi:hypothetical protein
MTIGELRAEFVNWRVTKERIVNFAIGISALLILEFVARPYYRPFIYSKKFYDLHIADTLGNSLGTIAAVFILIALIGRKKTQHYFLIKTITISVVLYELVHPMLGKPIDFWDVIATLVTGGFCYFLYWRIWTKKELRQRSRLR